MWLFLACSMPRGPEADSPAPPVDTSPDTAADSADTAADSAAADTAEDSEQDTGVDTGDPPDTGLWSAIPCDTGGVSAPRYGVDTGACPTSAELDAALAAIPDPDDASCPWAAPVDTGGGVATGCPSVTEEGAQPEGDAGCIRMRKYYDGEARSDQIYDSAGLIVQFLSDDIGARYLYDVVGNLVRQDTFWEGELRWPGQYEYDYTYDADGHVLSVDVYEYGTVSERITYSYDDAGRLATACGDRPYTETYTWTDEGQLASYGFDGADPDTTDGGGWFTYVIALTYDAEGRLSAEYIDWIYDSWGFNDDSAWAWTYDADGNRRREYRADVCGPWSVVETWTYTYAADCSVSVTSDAWSVVREYDSVGRLVLADWSSFDYAYEYAEVECPC